MFKRLFKLLTEGSTATNRTLKKVYYPIRFTVDGDLYRCSEEGCGELKSGHFLPDDFSNCSGYDSYLEAFEDGWTTRLYDPTRLVCTLCSDRTNFVTGPSSGWRVKQAKE